LALLVLVEDWEFVIEVLFVIFTKKSLDGSAIESKICNHALESKFQENLEEDFWVWLSSNKKLDLRLGLTGIDTLKQEKLSKSNLMDFNFEDVVKMSLAISIRVLLLEAHLSIIIELAGEEQMVCWLDLNVVNGSKRVDES